MTYTQLYLRADVFVNDKKTNSLLQPVLYKTNICYSPPVLFVCIETARSINMLSYYSIQVWRICYCTLEFAVQAITENLARAPNVFQFYLKKQL